MKFSLVFFLTLAIGGLIFVGIVFRFYPADNNGASLIRGEALPVKNIPFTPIKISAPSMQDDNHRTIDYSKILEKYKGRDMELVAMEKKLIALTFDGGGNNDSAERIIEVLSRDSIQSSFFLTGQFMDKFPETVEAIKDSGAEIANHTYSHKDLTSLSVDEAEKEISQMKEVAQKYNLTLSPFFRFPYGARDKESIALVNDLGYVSVRWTVDSLGWQGKIKNHDAKFVADRVVGKASPGAIVLMHLGSAQDKSTLDADALIEIIATLKNAGYQFVTLSELFAESL